MKLTILGPNLSAAQQAKGDFHVHKAGCADIKKYGPVEGAREEYDFETMREVVEFVYPPESFHWTKADLADYLVGFHILPCTKGLPMEAGDEGLLVD